MQDTLTKRPHLVPGVLSGVLACLFPVVVHGQVLITEIMYAPESADTDREWVEVCNAGNEAVSIEDWILYENDVNHRLELVRGSWDLGTHECAIIADDAETFRDEYTTFSGVLIDSAFSLRNTGETIALKNAAGEEVDSITYSNADGAENDGDTLHRDGGVLTAGEPTPGTAGNLQVNAPQEQEVHQGETSGGGSVTTITQYNYELLSVEPPQDVHVRVPERLTSVAGGTVLFYAESYDARGRTLEGGNIAWAFGDGRTQFGREVQHRYMHPGTYLTTVTLRYGTLRDEKLITVEVYPLAVALLVDEQGEWAAIENYAQHILDVSAWRIRAGGYTFIIPQGTRILAGTSVRFDTRTLKIPLLRTARDAGLFFPDGSLAVRASSATALPATSTATTTEDVTPSVDREHETINTSVPVVSTGTNSPESVVGMAVAHLREHTTVVESTTPPMFKEVTRETPLEVSPEISPEISQEIHTAAALASGISHSDGSAKLWWYVALSALLTVGAAGIVFARHSVALADQFEIIEKT